jgi:hypothetical protein
MSGGVRLYQVLIEARLLEKNAGSPFLLFKLSSKGWIMFPFLPVFLDFVLATCSSLLPLADPLFYDSQVP